MDGTASVHYCEDCKNCKKVIIGSRWKCIICAEYDLCGPCYCAKNSGHNEEHEFREVKEIVNYHDENPWKNFVAEVEGIPDVKIIF